eukprot:scaffold2140_cov394-Prasinococcus_capsulatus_cf.AAC.9
MWSNQLDRAALDTHLLLGVPVKFEIQCIRYVFAEAVVPCTSVFQLALSPVGVKRASSCSHKPIAATFQGPFGDAYDVLGKHVVCVGGGLGIVPMLSVAKSIYITMMSTAKDAHKAKTLFPYVASAYPATPVRFVDETSRHAMTQQRVNKRSLLGHTMGILKIDLTGRWAHRTLVRERGTSYRIEAARAVGRIAACHLCPDLAA